MCLGKIKCLLRRVDKTIQRFFKSHRDRATRTILQSGRQGLEHSVCSSGQPADSHLAGHTFQPAAIIITDEEMQEQSEKRSSGGGGITGRLTRPRRDSAAVCLMEIRQCGGDQPGLVLLFLLLL